MPPRTDINIRTYSDMVAKRLLQLREDNHLTIDELQTQLERCGRRVSRSSVYSYEKGANNGGSNIPLDLLPSYARIFNLRSTGDLLP